MSLKKLYYIPTGEKVSFLQDFGNRVRVLWESGEVSTEPREKLAEQATLITHQTEHEQALAEPEAEIGKREDQQTTPDLEALPLFGIEMNAAEQCNLFQGA